MKDQKITSVTKLIDAKQEEKLLVYNCKTPFCIFEKEGDLFLHSIYLQTDENYSTDIQTIANFKMDNVGLITLSKKFIHLCTNTSDENQSFNFKSIVPYQSFAISGKTIRKMEVFEQNKRTYVILILSFYKGQSLKYETRIIDFE